MNSSDLLEDPSASNCPRWYVIYCQPKHEDRAENNLKAWQVETFNPKIRVLKPRIPGRARRGVIKPLFPRYLFARFDRDKMLHKISFTRGVCNVVNFGSGPVPVEDGIIALIKSRVAEDGFIKVGEKIEFGDRVRIEIGPFRNLAGIFEREIKGTERVRILLDTINYEPTLVLDRSQIRKVG